VATVSNFENCYNTFQKLLYNCGALSFLLFEMFLILLIQNNINYLMLASGTVALILGTYQNFLIQMCKKRLAPMNIQVESISIRNKIAIFSNVSYIVPMSKLFWEDMNVYILIGISVFIIFIFVRINYVVANPILLLLGYHSYIVKLKNGISDYTLLSKRKIRNSNQIKRVYRVQDYLLLEES